jgi:hypothetical protein
MYEIPEFLFVPLFLRLRDSLMLTVGRFLL